MLLLYVYIGSLVVGGILLGASFLLGHDADADADVDLDGDVHVELDADVDGDIDGGDIDGADVDHGDADVGGGGGFAEVWLPFVSLRFWVFFLAFFGVTGTVLSLFALAGKWTTLVAALAMGLVIGFFAAFIIQRLKKQVVGEVVGEGHFKGLEGTVLLPIPDGLAGKVRLMVQGQTVDLAARTDAGQAIGQGAKVLVIDCVEGTLQVVPAEELTATEGSELN